LPKTRPREVRERIGHDLLDADDFAFFVWDDGRRRFGDGVFLTMSADNLARYDSYDQTCDPITLKLQARRVPTLVKQVMAQRDFEIDRRGAVASKLMK
jgi:hypothetical protein